ncbi:MAG: ribonuclease P protein component [Gammaproteobacteria bacterium]|nr:ribonuclease P protein component [Gammaproteobacteria bacterium]
MTIDQTFPRSARLTSPDDFKTVFKNANRLNFKEFTVYVLQNNRPESRLGLAISKKSAKKAVSRNLIKRIIRDSFRKRRNKLKGWDIVFVSRVAAVKMTNSELEVLTVKVWKRLES